MARFAGAAALAATPSRRWVMRAALTGAAGALAVPILTACGGAAATNNTSSSTSSSTATSSSSISMPTYPSGYKGSWPLNVAGSEVAVPGSMYAVSGDPLNGGLLEMAAFGNDVWNNADNCSFWGEKVSGDGTWSVEVAIQAPTNTWAKAGIMLRQSLDPTDIQINIDVTPSHGVNVQDRGYKGAQSYDGYTIDSVATAPIYLKLQKTGTTITAWDSTDGQNWNNKWVGQMIQYEKTGKPPAQCSSSTSSSSASSSSSTACVASVPANHLPVITDPYYVGLFCCSHAANLRGRVGFDNITGFKNPTYTAIYNASVKSQW